MGSSTRVQFWSVLAARLRELAVLTERGMGAGQRASHRHCIVQLMRGQTRNPPHDSDLDEWEDLVANLGSDRAASAGYAKPEAASA
eukprot:15523989-Heterocapsa_arctica.AAC.1